jgi:mevalonate kinase
MAERWVGRGHGKLILSGEHAVVYGHPAIAIAVDRGVTARLRRRPGPTATELHTPADDRMVQALRVVLPGEGWCVDLESDLPLGRGMGSSAAIAVALVRAWAAASGETLDHDAVWERAFEVERIFHGTPSGLDHAVSCRGGALRYQKGPPPRFEPLPCPTWPLVVLDSGVAGDTRALVDAVRARRPGIDSVLDEIGALVTAVEQALHDPARLGPLLTENHRLLQRIGVSNHALDELVQLALDAGAFGAKLAGAGGGGVVLALTADPDRLLAQARDRQVPAFSCRPVPAEETP